MEEKFLNFLKSHSIIGIDTMVFIYHFEKSPEYSPLTLSLFDHIEKGFSKGVTSILTKLEIMVKPKLEGNQNLARTYDFLLRTFPNLVLRDLDDYVVDSASTLRAKYKIRTPDAIQVASALVGGASLFITNDSDLKKVSEVEIVIMREFLAGQ